MRLRAIGMITGLVWVLMLAGSALAQGGGLVGAEWGVQGRRGVDVTARVRTFIHEGVLQLEATRFNLGIDPAPHENKVLVIHLRQRDGDVKDYSYPERSVVRLELDHEEWHGRREDQDRHDHDAHNGDYERRDHDGRREEEAEDEADLRHRECVRLLAEVDMDGERLGDIEADGDRPPGQPRAAGSVPEAQAIPPDETNPSRR